MLPSSGTAVVLDFGIAKALAASKTQAPSGPAGASPRIALASCRYGEGGELAAGRWALDPASGRGDWQAALVAAAVGDS